MLIFISDVIVLMTPEEFKIKWTRNNSSLTTFSPDRLEKLNLLPSTKDFLMFAGLPILASPNLWFTKDVDDIVYGINKLTDQFDILKKEFDKYVVIGSCNNGDAIAINTEKEDQIEWLDHEDWYSSRFFNSSINSLSHCLLYYRDFELTILEENSKDTLVKSNFTNEQIEKLKFELMKVDFKAMTEDGFWKEQIEIEHALKGNRIKNR